MKKETIVIFDRHRGIIRKISDSLYPLTENIICVDNAEALLTSHKRYPVDLFILNVYPNTDEAYSFCHTLSQNSSAPIIVITPADNIKSRILAYEHGADVAFPEDYDSGELAAAAKRLILSFRNKASQSNFETSVHCGRLIVNTESLTAFINGEALELTTKEALILILLIKNANRTVENQKLYETVWGDAYSGNSCVLRTHISNLKNKIGTASTDDYDIVSVRGAGYSFVTT